MNVNSLEYVAPNIGWRACRACLTTECKLFDLHSNNLAEELSELTGTAVKLGDGLPRYMCSVCCALLRKGAAFRKKCRAAISTFQDYFSSIVSETVSQDDYLSVISKSHVHTAFVISNVVKIDIPDQSTQNQDDGITEVSVVKHIHREEDHSKIEDDRCKEERPQDEPKGNILDPLGEQLCEIDYVTKEVKIEIETIAPQRQIDKAEPLKKDQQSDETGIKFDSPSRLSDTSDDNFDTSDQFLSDIKTNDRRKRSGINKSYKDIKSEISKGKTKKLCNIKDKPRRRSQKRKPFKKILRRAEKPRLSKESELPKKVLTRKRKPIAVIKSEDSSTESEDTVNSDSDFDEDSILQQVSKIKRENAVLTKKGDANKVDKRFVKQSWEKKYNIKVEYLSKEEQIRDLKARQATDDYIGSTFKCKYCYKGFMKEESYNRHMVFHDPSTGSKVCEICHTYFNRLRSYGAHKMRHKMKFTCKECGHVTSGIAVAKTHYEWHNGKSYGCKICGKVYNTKSTYTSHLRYIHGSIRCHICHKMFVNEHGRKMHMLKAHRKEMSQYRCGVCSVQFISDTALRRHVGEAPDSGCTHVWPCEHCGLNLSDKQSLLEHMQGDHDVKHSLECDITFNENGEIPTVNKSKSKRVQSAEKKEKEKNSFMCEFCSKCYRYPASLAYHRRAHTGEKPFQCSMCPKGFGFKRSLETHMRVHTGEKPYKCTHCDKAFCQSGNRDRHVSEVHVRDTQYTCESCEKTYTSKSALSWHVRTIHMNLPWPKRNRTKIRQ